MAQSKYYARQSPVVRSAFRKFAAEVRAWRKRIGAPRQEVVASIGITPQQLASIEKETSHPSYAVYILLRAKMGYGP